MRQRYSKAMLMAPLAAPSTVGIFAVTSRGGERNRWGITEAVG